MAIIINIMTLSIISIIMITISIIGFIANGKEVEFTAEVLVAICFILFIFFLVYALRSIVFNSLNDELFKVFLEFESIYKLKQKEMELLVENYSKVNLIKEDLIELNNFLDSKLINIIELKQDMLTGHVNRLLRTRLNNIIQVEHTLSDNIHASLVDSVVAMYTQLNNEYSSQKVWSDNITSINELSSSNGSNLNPVVENINIIKKI